MRKSVHILLIALFVLAVSGIALAEDKAQPQQPTPEQMQEMMKQYEAKIAPGPQHQDLAKSVGNWKTVSKMWQMPGAEPMVTTGVATARIEMGGRYLIEESQMEMMGMPYKGFNVVAYDNLRQEYQMVYFDNMGTGIVTGKGKADADGKSVTMTGTMDDVMSGAKDMPMRYVMRAIDNDHKIFEMWGPGPDGKDFKMMEMTYERVK